MAKHILMIGAVSAALAVILGAFGAHALKAHLSSSMQNVYQTAVQYHFYHSLGLLLLGLIALHIQASSLLNWSAILMAVGLALFCGSLYVLVVTGIRWLGAITPIGGVSLIAAWLLLAITIWKAKL